MNQLRVQTHLGGHQRAGGEGSRCWMIWKKVFVFFLVGGILIGTQPIKAEATSLSRTSYDDGIPDEIREYCELVGNEYDICPELLEAIAFNESRFIETVTNENCWGLCQVNIKIHADRIEKYGYTEDDMLTAYPNIKVAADYLAELYSTYGDDNPIVLSLYSGAGWAAVERYKEYGTMTKHVENILTRSAAYERLHDK